MYIMLVYALVKATPIIINIVLIGDIISHDIASMISEKKLRDGGIPMLALKIKMRSQGI